MRGGRNTEYLLGAMPRSRGSRPPCGRHGWDRWNRNNARAAGRFAGARSRMGLDPRAALEGTTLRGVCRAGRFVLTGPTRTNVNDFRALLIV